MKNEVTRLQDKANDEIREMTIQRMVQGSKRFDVSPSGMQGQPNVDSDDEGDEDRNFMETYRQQRLAEMQKEVNNKSFGSVDMVCNSYLEHILLLISI